MHRNEPMAVVASVVATDHDAEAFCRRLASAVCQGPMHLVRAYQLATQVYPVRAESLTGTAMVMRCELRMRCTGTPVGPDAMDDVRRRLAAFEVLDMWLAGESGETLLDDLRVA